VRAIDHEALEIVLLGHLSEKNNTDVCAKDAVLASAPNTADRVHVLMQHSASQWYRLTGAPVAKSAEIDSVVET